MATCDYILDKVAFNEYQADYYNDIDDVALDKNRQALVNLIRQAIKKRI